MGSIGYNRGSELRIRWILGTRTEKQFCGGDFVAGVGGYVEVYEEEMAGLGVVGYGFYARDLEIEGRFPEGLFEEFEGSGG